MSGPAKRASLSGFTGNNASIFLDRTKAGMRGSTPDSEALASSDDEHDHLHRLQTVTSNPGPKPVRRASWFTETNQHSTTRKSSMGASAPFSPVSPSATTPGEQAPWGNHGPSTSTNIGRGHSNSSSFPWGNTIWNNDTQKGPPQRLVEVLPSPTTQIPPGSGGLPQEETTLRSPIITRDGSADPSIPFSIPLQPTPKTYRSQSYSVGQIDADASHHQALFGAAGAFPTAKRGASYAGINHRPSRPSMLGDTGHDNNPLGQLREVDDDDEEASTSPSQGGRTYQEDTRTFEEIAGENALLRQQLVANQIQSARSARPSFTNQRPQTSGQYYHQRLQDSVLEDNHTPLTSDERQRSEMQRSAGRRFSEFGTSSGPHYTLNVDADQKALEHAKKGQWQSSLGFARAEAPPQSRRHSFAEMPTRHNSIGSVGDDDMQHPLRDLVINAGDTAVEATDVYGEDTGRLPQGDNSKFAIFLSPDTAAEVEIQWLARHSLERNHAVRYFSRIDSSSRPSGDLQTPPTISLQQSYAQSHYNRPQILGQPQLRSYQSLYIVTFKCLRADVFFVQEGTGLRVKKGDLVIVEADRGTDLGTVQSDLVSWSEAKQLKDEYTKKHHEWLMAFSHHAQNGTVAGPNPNGPALSQSSSGLSPTGGFQDLPSGEIKPKLIKRLAQTHEIATLREKEGGEAKAKRMCQQKVVDHRLNMEILDAEFQMDWKKLTFFYFADAYINFNPLVTDLFKIYKTRIWMSAINTAAIASPHGGLKQPAVPSRNGLLSEYEESRSGQYTQSAAAAPPQTSVAGFNGLYDMSRSGVFVGGMNFESVYPQAYPPPNFENRQVSPFPGDYRPQSQQAMNIPSQYGHSAGYGPAQLHHASSFGSNSDTGHGVQPNRHVPSADWAHAFQGMSLGR